jgi:hypothetical protein
VRSAADTVLETLKSENMKDFDKKKEVEEVLGPVTGETFSQFINLSKKITDYGAEDETMADPDMERKDAEINEVDVAVVFDKKSRKAMKRRVMRSETSQTMTRKVSRATRMPRLLLLRGKRGKMP